MWRTTPALTLTMLWIAGIGLPAALTLPVQTSSETAVGADFRAGQQAVHEGRFDLAVEEYQKVLRLDPSLVEARFNLGLAYQALGKYDDAVRELEVASRQRPDIAGLDLFLGLDYMKLGSPAKAVPHLRAALQPARSRSEAQAALLACYRVQNDYADTTLLLKSIAGQNPRSDEQLYILGQGYLALAAKLADTLSREHQSAWVNRLTGDMLSVQHLWADAAVKYQEALATNDAQPGLHAALGLVYLQQAKYSEAEVECKTELRRDPGNEDALLGLAEVDIARNSPSDALAAISRLWAVFPPFLARQKGGFSITLGPSESRQMAGQLEAAPASPAKSFLLASLDRAAGDLQDAETQWVAFEHSLDSREEGLDTASNRDTTSEVCESHQYSACARLLDHRKSLSVAENLMLGYSLLALGQDQGAEQSFTTALSSDSINPAAAYWLVRTSLKLGEEYFTKLVTLFPNSWRAHEFAGDADRLRFDASGAVKEYDAAIRQRPDSAELYEDLGRAHFMEGDLAHAESALKTALQLNPRQAGALYILGSMYLNQHQNQKSIACLRAAVRWDPELLDARAALGRAYMRNGDARSALPELEKAAATDIHGDVHYLLYQAFRALGEPGPAQAALVRSQELRRISADTLEQNVKKAFGEERRE